MENNSLINFKLILILRIKILLDSIYLLLVKLFLLNKNNNYNKKS